LIKLPVPLVEIGLPLGSNVPLTWPFWCQMPASPVRGFPSDHTPSPTTFTEKDPSDAVCWWKEEVLPTVIDLPVSRVGQRPRVAGEYSEQLEDGALSDAESGVDLAAVDVNEDREIACAFDRAVALV
jgi:hypothetical protein